MNPMIKEKKNNMFRVNETIIDQISNMFLVNTMVKTKKIIMKQMYPMIKEQKINMFLVNKMIIN